MEAVQIDRDVVREVYRTQNLQRMVEFVQKGELTQKEAAAIHMAFMKSAVLDRLIEADIERVSASLNGQIH